MTTKNKPVKAMKKQAPLPSSKPSQSAKKPVQHVPVKTAPKQPPKPAQKVVAKPTTQHKRAFTIKKESPAVSAADLAGSNVTTEVQEKMKREFEEANKVQGNASDLSELPIISFYRTTGFLDQIRGTKL